MSTSSRLYAGGFRWSRPSCYRDPGRRGRKRVWRTERRSEMRHGHRWLIGVLVGVVLAGLVLIAPGEEGARA